MVARGAVTYAYDGLDRVARRDGVAFAYAGVDLDPVDDGPQQYSHGPSGDVLAWSDGTVSRHVGDNRHGDLAYVFDADGAVVAGRVYDPYGTVAGESGTAEPSRGFQSDWTDPASGEVWMGARWYSPAEAAFTARDTYAGVQRTPISLNRHTYAFGDPMQFFDPDGREPRETSDGRYAVPPGTPTTPEAQKAARDRHRRDTTLPTFGGITKPRGWDSWSLNQRLRWIDRNWSRKATPISECSYACTFAQSSRKTLKTVAKVGASVGAGVGCTVATGGNVVAGAVCGGAAYRMADNALSGRPLLKGVLSPRNILFDATVGLATAGTGRLLAPVGKRLAQSLGNRIKVAGPKTTRFVQKVFGGKEHSDVKTRATKFRPGRPIAPDSGYEAALRNPLQRADRVVEKYGINLRAQGRKLTLNYDEHLSSAGKVYGDSPTVINFGDQALLSEEELARTIAHELRHSRAFLGSGSNSEKAAYASEERLAEWINGLR